MDNHKTVEYKGAFRLVNKVAEGGMATVYEAEQLGPEGFTKRIALKVIHPHYAKRTEFLRLFIDEAKLSANLMHGNVVQIYQLGEVGGEYFIAMEFIQGPTLRNVIDRHYELGTPIPATLAAYICSRVARALDFAHNFVSPRGTRLDIVHRDVSPGNVMITWDGHIKLADFGIAKARTSFDPASEQKMRIGKKHYMSPEQVLGSGVDGKSDVPVRAPRALAPVPRGGHVAARRRGRGAAVAKFALSNHGPRQGPRGDSLDGAAAQPLTAGHGGAAFRSTRFLDQGTKRGRFAGWTPSTPREPVSRVLSAAHPHERGDVVREPPRSAQAAAEQIDSAEVVWLDERWRLYHHHPS